MDVLQRSRGGATGSTGERSTEGEKRKQPDDCFPGCKLRTVWPAIGHRDFEVSAAPAIDPNLISRETVGTIEIATGVAALPSQANAVIRADIAGMPMHVVGCAGHDGYAVVVVVVVVIVVMAMTVTRTVATSLDNIEVGTAAAINPKLVTVDTPRLAFNTLRVAALARQAHPAVIRYGAEMAAHVIGGTGEGADAAAATAVIPAAAATGVDLEVSATTAIYPNLFPAHAVRLALDAARIAVLADHRNPAVWTNVTGVISHVVGTTCHDIGLRPGERTHRNYHE